MVFTAKINLETFQDQATSIPNFGKFHQIQVLCEPSQFCTRSLASWWKLRCYHRSKSMLDRDTEAFYAIASLYAISSVFFGNWYAAIPFVEENRGISDGTLGDYFSIATVGAVICMTSAPFILDYIGSNYGITLGYIITGLGMILMCINSSDAFFIFSIIIYGYGAILVYSAMVAQGAVLEKSDSKLWMGLFVAASGVGGIFGGLVGGLSLEYTWLDVWAEMLIVCGILCALVVFGSLPWLYTRREEKAVWHRDSENDSEELSCFATFYRIMKLDECFNWGESASDSTVTIASRLRRQEAEPILSSADSESGFGRIAALPSSCSSASYGTQFQQEAPKIEPDYFGLLVLCGITFITYFVEDSVGDWGSIYIIHHWTDSSYLLGITPYLLEKACLTVASLSCDYLCTYHFSRYEVFQVSLLLTMIGFAMAVIGYFLPVTTAALAFTITGFGVAGIGMGLTFPIAFSMSGRGIRGFTATQSVSWTMTAALCGSLLEPLILGNISSVSGSLAYSFVVVVGSLVLMMVLAMFLPSHYFDFHSTK